jgi:hypothetical protein
MDDQTRAKRCAYILLSIKEAGLEGAKAAQFLKRRTGQTTVETLSDADLDALAAWFKPTTAQWKKIGYFCRVLGWSGFDDPAFLTFARRVTTKENTKLLNKMEVRKLIGALSSMINNLDHHGRLPPAAAAPDARLSPEANHDPK